MSSFVVLVGLQFYILFIIQQNFVIADEKTSLETSKRQVVGQCGDRKSDPLDTKIHWKDACYDFDGNSYKDGDFLMSCCGCFKFICSNKTKEDPPCDDKYGWDKVLEATCCEDCHGQVFPAGSVIKEQKLEDKCSTTVTTKCVLASGEKKATIDESLSYEKCCSNSSGVYSLNTSVLVPALCSVRVCSQPAGRHEASWTLTKKTTGCDCCQYRGKLIADKDWVIIGKGHNARNATCCEGKLLVSIDDEDVSSTTSEDETVGITTNGDKEIGITQEVEKSTRSVLWIGIDPWTTLTIPDFSPASSNCTIPQVDFHKEPGQVWGHVYYGQNINGVMYVCGKDKCKSYTSQNKQWVTETEMKLKRQRAASTFIEGNNPKWIVHGGDWNPATQDVWTQETRRWKVDTDFRTPLPVYGHCIVAIDGEILQIGGVHSSYEKRVFLGKNEVASMRVGLVYLTCTLFQNLVWVAGGSPQESNLPGSVQVYNHTADSWTEGPTLPLEKHDNYPKLMEIQGALHYIGGYDAGKIFKLENNAWVEVAPVQKGSKLVAAVLDIEC